MGSEMCIRDSYGVAEDGTNAVITVSRNGGITQTANVLFSTVSGGTAIDGINYIGRSQLLTFGPSVTSQTVAIPVIDDTAVNTDRTVNMQLSNPSGPFGTQLGAVTQATLTITNNDATVVAGSVEASFTNSCLLYTSPSPRDLSTSRMPSSA